MAIPLLRSDKTIKGGELVARMLAAEGVETAFGIIDGTYLGLFGAFEPNGIRLITPRHETSAAHMAAAYARLTGKLGVCIASNGPGVANITIPPYRSGCGISSSLAQRGASGRFRASSITLPTYRLAMSPHTSSGFDANSSGPGCRLYC